MNRRRLLIVFAIVLPIAVFVVVQWAARWRPHKVSSLPLVVQQGEGYPVTMSASDREIVFGNMPSFSLYDLQSGESRPLQVEGISTSGTALWRIIASPTKSLVVRQGDERERAYPIPSDDLDEMMTAPREFIFESLKVAANSERVELLAGTHYYRWNAASGKLERATNCEYPDDIANQTLARDGEHLINAGEKELTFASTRSGKIDKRIALSTELLAAVNPIISPFGTYAIYPVSPSGRSLLSTLANWNFVSTKNGRVLWKVQVGTDADIAVFAPDESRVAVLKAISKVWEIRDPQTGKILRTLPLVPGTQIGTFSPDGTMLYSVADGVLYRQRAR